MFFKQVEAIARGAKTCTQRVVQPGEIAELDAEGSITQVRSASGRLKWYLGGSYVVSPGRGKRAAMVLWRGIHDPAAIRTPNTEQGFERLAASGYEPLRIRLRAIERVRVQTMDARVAAAEGVATVAEYAALWATLNLRPGTRWADDPLVWRLWFEVAR